MTKSQLTHAVSTSTGYDRTEVSEILEEVLRQIRANTAQGVYFRGFGCFTEKTRKAKPGRNITAGTRVEIPEHKIAHFKAYFEI